MSSHQILDLQTTNFNIRSPRSIIITNLLFLLVSGIEFIPFSIINVNEQDCPPN